MLEKTKEREKRKKRPTWCGYYTRKTPTKREKELKNARKYKERFADQARTVGARARKAKI